MDASVQVVGARVNAASRAVAEVAATLPAEQLARAAETGGAGVPGMQLAAALTEVGAGIRQSLQVLDETCATWVTDVRDAMNTYAQTDVDAAQHLRASYRALP